MLKLIVGRAGTGKTKYAIDLATQYAKNNKQVILIVPEQISFLYEKKIEKIIGSKKADLVFVGSFKKICYEIFKKTGGISKRRIDDEIRVALVKRAVDNIGENLSLFGKKKDTVSFCSIISFVLSELKNSGVSGEKLLEISNLSKSETSKIKLKELTKIFFAYDGIVSEKYSDPSDELYDASKKAVSSDIFKDKLVIFDGFSGFTAPERALLVCAIEQSEDVAITFTTDSDLSDNRFETVSASAKFLISTAKKLGVEHEIVSLTSPHRFKAEGLKQLERFLYEGECSDNRDGVFEYSAKTINDEVKTCAAEIVRLVREHDYSFSDIAVAVRDLTSYKQILAREFETFGIPFFCDFKQTAKYNAVSVFIRCCFELIDKPTDEKFLEIVKTGLFPISTFEQSELLNYMYIWGVSFEELSGELLHNPKGLAENEMTAFERERLSSINETARAVYAPIKKLIDSSKNKPCSVIIKNILSLLEGLDFKKNLETFSSDDEISSASAALLAVEKLYDITLFETLSPKQLLELYSLLVSVSSTADIPKTLEQVQIGSADRMRADNPRAVFCLGLNASVFPKEDFEAQFLSYKERDLFFENGIDLALRFENSVSLEDVFFYRTLTYPTDRIYLFSSKTDVSRNALEKTPYLSGFLEKVDIKQPPVVSQEFAFSVNQKTFERELASNVSNNMSVNSAFFETDIVSNDYKKIISDFFFVPKYKLSDSDVIKKLYPETLSLSPSRIEQFSRCRFAYFLNYSLKIRPIKKAEISPLEAGSFFHAIIETVMKQANLDLALLSTDEIKSLARKAGEQYLESRLGARFLEVARIKYLCENMISQAEKLLLFLQTEQKQTRFETVGVEISVARGGDSSPIVLKGKNGETIYIEGKVDRVDMFEQDSQKFLRVIDYKSSGKTFSLDEVAVGLNLQMLIYLFALCRSSNEKYKGATASGVLYLPLDPAPDPKSNVSSAAYRMEGLVLDEVSVISAMENDANGVFIPVRLNVDGSPNKNSSALTSLKRFAAIEQHVTDILHDIADKLYSGDIDAEPIKDKQNFCVCDYCDYSAVCRKSKIKKWRPIPKGAALDKFSQ